MKRSPPEIPQPPQPERKRRPRLAAFLAGTLALGLPDSTGERDEHVGHEQSQQNTPDKIKSAPTVSSPNRTSVEYGEPDEAEGTLDPKKARKSVHDQIYHTLIDDQRMADWILEKGISEDVQDSYSDAELERRVGTYVDWMKSVRLHGRDNHLEIFVDGVATIYLSFAASEEGVRISGTTPNGPLDETLQTPDQLEALTEYILGSTYSRCIAQFKERGEPIE